MIVSDLIARRRLHSSGSPAFRKASNPDGEDTLLNPLIELAFMTLGGVK